MKHQDIELSAEQVAEVTRYRKSFGAEYVAACLDARRASIYVERELEEVGRNVSSRMCFSAGTITFRRKDGGPITDEDVAALEAIPRGQENHVRSRAVDHVTIYFACDSGD